jgi:AcrR family transcriptional regulator
VAEAGTLALELRDDRRPPAAPALRARVTEAAVACLARHGTLKTTVDDVAREAGVSRATVYRAFPGGRDEVLHAVVDTEAARLFGAVEAKLARETDLSAALVAAIVEASTRIREHPAVRYLLAHEPGTILGHLAFDEADRVLATSARRTAPFLARWMGPGEAERVAEWATRIVLSYAIAPSAGCDLTDPGSTTRLVETFVMPGIRALNASGAERSPAGQRAHRSSTNHGHHASQTNHASHSKGRRR